MGFTNTNGINTSSNDFEWKMVYDDNTKDIIILEKFSGITKTKKDVYMGTNFKDVADFIQTNSLNYNSIIINDYNTFHTEAMKDLVSPTDDAIINLIESFHPDNWTLVYDNTAVLFLLQDQIKIDSSYNVFTDPDITICFDKITELGLIFSRQSEFEESYPDYFGIE